MPIDYTKAYEFEDGIQFTEGSWVGSSTTAPNISGGVEAPIGSVIFQSTGDIWKKFNSADTDWELIFTTVFNAILPGSILSHNGTISDGQLIGYNNLVNNPIVLGFRCSLLRITMINSNSSADGTFRFYKNVAGTGTPFATFSYVNSSPNNGTISGSPIFEIGDILYIYFDKDGQNTSDLSLTLFFKAET